MAVYVDDYNAPFRGMIMCHMMADTLDELHEMADAIGIQRKWFQPKSRPHYDVCKAKRALAVEHGAIEMETRELVMYFMKREGKL